MAVKAYLRMMALLVATPKLVLVMPTLVLVALGMMPVLFRLLMKTCPLPTVRTPAPPRLL